MSIAMEYRPLSWRDYQLESVVLEESRQAEREHRNEVLLDSQGYSEDLRTSPVPRGAPPPPPQNSSPTPGLPDVMCFGDSLTDLKLVLTELQYRGMRCSNALDPLGGIGRGTLGRGVYSFLRVQVLSGRKYRLEATNTFSLCEMGKTWRTIMHELFPNSDEW